MKSGDFLAAYSRHSDSGEQRKWRTDWVKSGKEERGGKAPPPLPPYSHPSLIISFSLYNYYAFPKRLKGFNRPFLIFFHLKPLFQSEAKREAIGMKTRVDLVCYTAVISVVTQRSSPGEERCVTTLKTAV